MVVVYSRDPEWWKYLISPTIFATIVVVLLCRYVLSPILATALIQEDKVKNLRHKKGLFHSYLGSLFHAVEAFAFAMYIFSTGELGKDRIFSISRNSITAMHVTLGFSLADTIICLLDPNLRKVYSNLIHHSCMVAGIVMGLYHQLYIYFIVYRFLSEFSTPFVDWRAVIYEVGDKNGKWYLVASVGMTISFFLCRVVVIPWHSYALFSAIFSAEAAVVPWYLNLYMVVNYTAFDALNLYWFYKILRGGYKLLVKKQHIQ